MVNVPIYSFHDLTLSLHSSSFATNSLTLPTERGPCPALNTLSNYNLLPHSGRGITLDIATSALKTGMNVGPDFVQLAVSLALSQCGALTNAGSPCTSFDLSMLRHPHAMEHDGSLSRRDSNNATQNNWSFDAKVFAEVLAVWDGVDILDRAIIKKARDTRQVNAKDRDYPGWYVDDINTSLAEQAFFRLVFAENGTVTARKDWVKFLFENEKLPLELGWAPNQRDEIKLADLLAESQAIGSA